MKNLKTINNTISAEKETGRVYTPAFIVDIILDLSGYWGKNILDKHVIDNSCGDGAFLCKIVTRYCKEFISAFDNRILLKKNLETFIHGIEIEAIEQKKCIKNLSRIAETFGVYDVNWDVLCEDALNVEKFNGKMDFVLGNPPYVRVHNLGENFNKIKEFSFSQNGMSDLFIVFYELGIKMLSQNGILGYITPSSYFNSIAGGYMRKYFVKNNLLKTVVDLQHFQAFSSTTYTAITILQNNRKEKNVEYYRFNKEKLIPYHVDSLTSDEYYISGNYYFSTKSDLRILNKIHHNSEQSDILVKNGYATLCDSVFINDFNFQSSFIIPVIKASKGVLQKIFFPYDKNSLLVSEDVLRRDFSLYKYLNENKEKLHNRSNERNEKKYWYAFGRSQAIGDTFRDKMAINSLLRSEEDFKFTNAPAGTGVYGGLYIISNSIPFEDISKVLKTKEFMSYISLLGKYKSGGYYTYSSKDVKRYLDYKFAYNGGIMSKNQQFLNVIRASFKTYLSVGTSQSTAKLKVLHGKIAKDIKELFGSEYTVLSQGIGNNSEGCIQGRYYPKNVDITVSKNGKPVAGYAVKFVMRNYSQNSNNYFENMLGETANIRANSIPYFQIFIVFEKVPYYKKGGIFQKYDILTEHNLEKYFALSKDDPAAYLHTPDKTLLIILKLKEKSPSHRFADSKDYAKYYNSVINDADLLDYSDKIEDKFDDSVILNDYEKFIKKTYFIAEGRTK